MHKELVKRLRSECSLPYSAIKDMRAAADAIEELDYKYRKALSDLVRQSKPPKEET